MLFDRRAFLGQVPLVRIGQATLPLSVLKKIESGVSDKDANQLIEFIRIFNSTIDKSDRQDIIDAFNTILSRWPRTSRKAIITYLKEIYPWSMDFFYNLVEPPPTPSKPPETPAKTPSDAPAFKTFPLGPKDVPTGDPRGEGERMRRERKTPPTGYPDTPLVPQGVLPWLPVTPKPWIPTTPMPSVPRSEPTTARESYEQKLKEFDARSRAPAPYEMTSEETQTESLRRHQEWMRSAGIQERPPVSTAQCPPNQFWDGTKCRGSISAMPGGIPVGGSGGPIGPTSSFAPTATPSAVMTGKVRFPVVNLRRI